MAKLQRELGCQTVGELMVHPSVPRSPAFVRALASALERTKQEGLETGRRVVERSGNLLEAFTTRLAIVQRSRMREVLEGLSGLHGSAETVDALAYRVGMPRHRLRRMEEQALRDLGAAGWGMAMRERVHGVWQDRLMSLTELAREPWFSCVAAPAGRNVLLYLLGRYFEDGPVLITTTQGAELLVPPERGTLNAFEGDSDGAAMGYALGFAQNGSSLAPKSSASPPLARGARPTRRRREEIIELERHFEGLEEWRRLLVPKCCAIMRTQPRRRWSADELLEGLRARGEVVPPMWSGWHIVTLLRRSEEVRCLGREGLALRVRPILGVKAAVRDIMSHVCGTIHFEVLAVLVREKVACNDKKIRSVLVAEGYEHVGDDRWSLAVTPAPAVGRDHAR